MYTGYKKFHAFKLVIICSLFTKAILSIIIVPARCSDSAAFTGASDVWMLMALASYLLGDDAFHGLKSIIPPFSTKDLNSMVVDPALQKTMRVFNQGHSSNRMSSEHVIGRLKRWSVIRGTAKYRQFADMDFFKVVVKAVQCLENARVSGFQPERLWTTRKR
jgi:hypothetical protein